MFKIFVDMDGVLTDFMGGVQKLYKKNLDVRKLIEEEEVKLWDAINSEGMAFWSGLSWMRDGKKLWNHVKKYRPILLTALPEKSICEKSVHVEKGKLEWVKRELGEVATIMCRREEKKCFAGPSHILIDDDFRNIREWKAENGIAIWHNNSNTTIVELELGLMELELKLIN